MLVIALPNIKPITTIAVAIINVFIFIYWCLSGQNSSQVGSAGSQSGGGCQPWDVSRVTDLGKG